MPNYAVGIGSSSDIDKLLHDVFAHFGVGELDKLRQMSRSDVAELIALGRLWYGLDTTSGDFVGTAHVKVTSTGEAEFGGVAVLAPHRRTTSLALDLSACSLASFILDNFYADPPIPIIARVHVDNRAVARSLGFLGFEGAKRLIIDPSEATGFDLMPRAEDGMIHAVRFLLGNEGTVRALEHFYRLAPAHALDTRFPLADIEAAIADLELQRE